MTKRTAIVIIFFLFILGCRVTGAETDIYQYYPIQIDTVSTDIGKQMVTYRYLIQVQPGSDSTLEKIDTIYTNSPIIHYNDEFYYYKIRKNDSCFYVIIGYYKTLQTRDTLFCICKNKKIAA